jgi:endo-1,4-beta-D-glucanase Y
VNRLLHLLLVALAGGATAATNYPYPYMTDYPYGIRPASIPTTMHSKIQSLYTQWMTETWAECPDGKKARIKWIDAENAPKKGCTAEGSCTVSEGIGYGMLITVYMDNAANLTQSKFDKLWAYYNAYSTNGLMNWVVDGCNGTKQSGAATDADLDVALALGMAYRQWGDVKYLDGAKALLGSIWAQEVKNNLIWSGNQWTDPVYNPSYFAIGAMRNVFSVIDPGHDWASLASNCLALIEKNQSAKGLNSDWSDASGNPVDKNGSGTTKFGYDAVRTPWRVLLDYLWSGNAKSKSVLEKINNWTMNSFSGPGSIKAEYLRDGTGAKTYSNACYTGALALPGMARDTAKTWTQKSYQALINTNPIGDYNTFYYEGSWQLLYLLTLTGNFQNYLGTVQPNTASIGNVGAEIPESWKITSTSKEITLSLPQSGEVDLIDAQGVIRGTARGSRSISLAKPNQRGVYFVVVRSAGIQTVIPIAHN